MNNSSNNPKSHPLLKPAWIGCLVLGLILLLSACTTPEPPFSEIVIVTPEDTPTLPPSPIPTMIPSPTITPSPTPYPEGAIAWGVIGENTPSGTLEIYETWARKLGEGIGLNVILVPRPKTEMEALEALRDGRIHIVTMQPLAYLVGNEQGWVEPGPIEIFGEQEAEAIMFISRTDTGFLPGEPPDVLQQLEGSSACWPETRNLDSRIKTREFDLPSYILPLGLLRLNGVENVWPVMKEGLNSNDYWPALHEAVFLEQCDFAAIRALSPEDFLSGSPNVDSGEWRRKMQILFTTQPINPFYSLFGFSSTLPEAVREQLTQAILANSGPYENNEYSPFNETLYDEFRRIALASGLDIQSFLTTPDS